MWISRLFVLFVIYSCVGWIYETIYCTIKWKKWENRGFLYGPLCPIYGTGCVCITVLLEHFAKVGFDYKWWQIFVICSLGSVVLEYGTHWTLEKLFHAVWWDYSYMPLNIHGRVCLPYTLCFGGAGIIVTYLLEPVMTRATQWITPIGYEFMGLLFMGLIGIDLALTASALSNFNHFIMDADAAVDMHMEQFVTNFGTKYGQMTDQMQAKIAEEKEKYSLERIRTRIDAMSAFSLSAVTRITEYRPKVSLPAFGDAIGSKISRNRIVEFIKDKKTKPIKREEES